MQRRDFPDGGFVLHKVSGNTSAWYDKHGTLLDAEMRDTRGRMQPVRQNTARYRHLLLLGRIHAPEYKANPRVTRKQVNDAAAEYQSRVSLYGEHEMGAQRAFATWKELQAQYEKQTGKPMYR